MFTRETGGALAAAPMRHGDDAVADLEPGRGGSIHHHADGFMPEFAARLAGAPGLPLGTHRRHQHLDLDDIARGLRLRLFRYQCLACTCDFYA
jgi:hypothetical protein